MADKDLDEFGIEVSGGQPLVSRWANAKPAEAEQERSTGGDLVDKKKPSPATPQDVAQDESLRRSDPVSNEPHSQVGLSGSKWASPQPQPETRHNESPTEPTPQFNREEDPSDHKRKRTRGSRRQRGKSSEGKPADTVDIADALRQHANTQQQSRRAAHAGNPHPRQQQQQEHKQQSQQHTHPREQHQPSHHGSHSRHGEIRPGSRNNNKQQPLHRNHQQQTPIPQYDVKEMWKKAQFDPNEDWAEAEEDWIANGV